jgi:hypothetical protein
MTRPSKIIFPLREHPIQQSAGQREKNVGNVAKMAHGHWHRADMMTFKRVDY